MRKLYNCKTSINQECLRHNTVPNYAEVEIPKHLQHHATLALNMYNLKLFLLYLEMVFGTAERDGRDSRHRLNISSFSAIWFLS
jgi:hypothetical protein